MACRAPSRRVGSGDANSYRGVRGHCPLSYCRISLQRRGIADFSALIALPNAPTDEVARALYNRGVTKDLRGDSKGAFTDWRAVIALPNAPVNEVEAARRQLQEPVRDHLLPRSLH